MSRLRARTASLAVLGTVLVTSLLTAPPAPAQATGFGRLYPPTHTPLRGDGFDLTGYLSSPVSGRPVLLQANTGTGWKPVASTTTHTGGKFAFSEVRLRTDANLRVRSRAWQRVPAARVLPPIVTKPVAVTLARSQSGTATVVPGIVQRGASPAAPVAGTQLVARFTPIWPDRKVILQQRARSGWVTVATTRQDPSGHADFTLPDTTSTYRAITATVRGTKWKTPRVITSAVTARDWQVIFEDTFDGPDLNPTWWSDQMLDSQPGVVAKNRTCSRINPAARRVADGVLHLGVTANPTRTGEACQWTRDDTGTTGTHPHMWNSQVMTKGKFEFTYGFVAARVKVQQAKGMHSAFWLQVPTIPKGDPASGTEIDVMEYFGDTGRRETNGVAAFVHWYDNDWAHQKRGGIFPDTATMKPAASDWWDEFHVFSVEWTPTAYVFRVDGREFHRETEAVSQKPEYLLFSMLTADYELAELTPEEWAQTAQADWVRVWAP